MKFIILQEDGNYYIDGAENVLSFLKKYVEYNNCGNIKAFSILTDSGQMDLAELIAYANIHMLPNYCNIKEIYPLGAKLY